MEMKGYITAGREQEASSDVDGTYVHKQRR
jgi:hypothetical protein